MGGRLEWARAGLEARLAGLLVRPVEHIGSTSIPGMIAKPQIDMMAPVRDLADGHAAAERRAELGYAARRHRIDAVQYVKPGGGEPELNGVDAHSLHLTTRDSELWRERLLFRDALRADPSLRDGYIDLKLAMLAGRRPYDSRDKREFVRSVLARAGHQLAEGLHDPAGSDTAPQHQDDGDDDEDE